MGEISDQSRREFVALYDRLGRRLLVYLARRLHDLDAAGELWSECWALALEGWASCRATSVGETEAWVFGIARNSLPPTTGQA